MAGAKISVLNPMGYPPKVTARPMAPRLESLEGKTVYLVDARFDFAENEERSPWEPFHVQHGFRPTDSAVSVFGGCRSTAFTLGLRERHWREHVRSMLRGMDPHSPPTLLLDPITARQFIDRGGFATKEQLIDWIYAHACMPAGEYWDYQLIQNYVYPRATFGEEPYATLLTAAPEEPIPMFRRDEIHVVVVGGYGKTVSVDDWR